LFRATCSSANVKAAGGGGGEREKRVGKEEVGERIKGGGGRDGKGREAGISQLRREKGKRKLFSQHFHRFLNQKNVF
jgi:hypothetical protein